MQPQFVRCSETQLSASLSQFSAIGRKICAPCFAIKITPSFTIRPSLAQPLTELATPPSPAPIIPRAAAQSCLSPIPESADPE